MAGYGLRHERAIRAATTTYKGNIVFSPPNAYHEVVNISSVGGTAETNPFFGGSTIDVMATRVGDCAR
jgi:hypothetical protein